MALSVHFAPIVVTDPEAALAFYRDALGLPVANDVSNAGSRWITLGETGGAQVVLSDPSGGRSPADAEALEELIVKGALGPFVLTTWTRCSSGPPPPVPRSCRNPPTSRGARATAPSATPPAT